MNTAEQSCGAFLDALASRPPSPAAEGLSRLGRRPGRALCTMVGTTPWASKNTPQWREDVKALMARAEDLSAPVCWAWWIPTPPPLSPSRGPTPSRRRARAGVR